MIDRLKRAYNAFMTRSIAIPKNSGSWFLAPSQAGVTVTPETALTYSPVFAAINAISSDIASLPYLTYERSGRGGKREAPDHPLYDLLAFGPNDELSSFDWEQAMYGHVLGWGNAYSEIVRDGNGELVGIYLLDPRTTEPKRDPRGRLYYETKDESGEIIRLPSENVIHLRGLAFDGIKGYSPITLGQQSHGLGMATELFGASFYGNSAIPSGVFEAAEDTTPEAVDTFRESIDRIHGGPFNAHRFMVTPPGWKWNQTQVSPENAQFLATRQFSVIEVCRWFNMNPIRLQDYSHSTYSNVEQAAIDYVNITLRPWMVKLETEIDRKCLSREERRRYFTRHDLRARLRGDSAAQSTFLREMLGSGVFSINDALADLDMNDVGPRGDKHYIALNMAAIEDQVSPTEPLPAKTPEVPVMNLLQIVSAVASGDLPAESAKAMIEVSFPSVSTDLVDSILVPLEGFKAKTEPEPQPEALTAPPEEAPTPSDEPAREAVRGVLVDSVGRMVRREVAALRKALKKSDFREAVEDFYGSHETIVRESVASGAYAFQTLVNPEDPTPFLVRRLVEDSRSEILSLAKTSKDLTSDVTQVLDTWESNKVESVVNGLSEVV